MKERPILFSGPMVRAILEGRKTQTRRIVKPQPPNGCEYVINGAGSHALCYHAADPRICVAPTPKSTDHRLPCPYGQPGDRLWVKETFRQVFDTPAIFEYRADGHTEHPLKPKWKPSIFCTRAASRITLEVAAVRVERLQDISPEDALAEGIEHYVPGVSAGQRGEVEADPIAEYRDLWEFINGDGSWAETPWVWVVEFRRIAP